MKKDSKLGHKLYRKKRQTLLSEIPAFADIRKYSSQNIERVGDNFTPRVEGDGIFRCGLQNAHGIRIDGGLQVPQEMDAIAELGINAMAIVETNCPWTPGNKWKYDFRMNLRFHGGTRTVYSSASADYRCTKYQPGGTMLTINGSNSGRVVDSGTDPLGRFCWLALRGHRDEGWLIISAYRVSQTSSHNAGATTAYTQQYTALRAMGKSRPDPRWQILLDMEDLIGRFRAKGFRPIIGMDANGDWKGKRPDMQMTRFIERCGLVDPFLDKFQVSTRTYINGPNRLDFWLMDAVAVPAIRGIGYLGTHEGAANADHVLGWVDFDERVLFQGVINRPVQLHSREFLIEQDDKVQQFLQEFIKKLETAKIAEKTFSMARSFVSTSDHTELIGLYHAIYGEFLDLGNGTAQRVGRKKFGYMRSERLTQVGRFYLLYKHALDCRRRQAPPSTDMLHRADDLGFDLDEAMSMPFNALRREVRRRRSELWDCQKDAELERDKWLQERAADRARAKDDPDWERKLRDMIRTARDRASNRKLTNISKGLRNGLDRIQVPIHDWFYSPKAHELYHFTEGVFEAYPSAQDSTFFTHHSLKVLPEDDVSLVTVTTDPTTSRLVIDEILDKPQSLWREVTAPNEIEEWITMRNRRHLQQSSIEGGMISHPIFEDMRKDFGVNAVSTSILDGGPDVSEYEISPLVSEWLNHLKQSDKEKKCPPVVGTISSEEFQEVFKKTKERTSSDPRTLNYTIWKCMAKSDYVSGIASVLLSLPFMYGFVNRHWLKMADVMLEKKPGNRKIHLLRIIGKLPAEFNTALKIFARKTMWNFESCDPHTGQWGSRPNRSAVDAAMIKALTFESARLYHDTMTSTQYDATAHFDRIHPSNSVVYSRKVNVDTKLSTTVAQHVYQMKRYPQTALGIGDSYYCQLDDEPHIGGEIQGKSDVPQKSNQQADIILKVHDRVAPGLCMKSPNLDREIKHNNIIYVDDNDGHVTADPASEDPVADVLRDNAISAQVWRDLVDITGGLVAMHKCNWQLIAWEFVNGTMEMVRSTDERLVLKDGKGAHSVIQFLSPDEPNKGLGFRLCPNGNQRPHHEATLAAVKSLCSTAQGAFLTRMEAKKVVYERLIPKISYALGITTLSAKQCGEYNTAIRRTFVGPMGMNSNYPSAVLYGPAEYGGMEFPEVYSLQDQVQFPYLIRQLRWDKDVANDFLVVLDRAQLVSGFVRPILEVTKPRFDLFNNSFILDLRRRLSEIDASLWIERAWTPSLQREGDSSIMERISSLSGMTLRKLYRVNACRLYMRVITISDLVNESGTHIPDNMLEGEWQAGSDLLWPRQESPPKPWWALFRQCLRRGYATSTNPHQPSSYSMKLDYPLGRWRDVPRSTWYSHYYDGTSVYTRDIDGVIHRLSRTRVSGFYAKTSTVDEIPLAAHPIVARQVGEKVWTQRPHNIQRQGSAPPPPPGHVVENTLCDPSDTLIIGSDGSVHLREQVSTAAWVIRQSDTQQFKAVVFLENISSVSSHRAELEGIFRLMKHIEALEMTTEQIAEMIQSCDNEKAVAGSNVPPATPSQMMLADSDVVMAIHHLRTSLPELRQCRHVYGHQNERTRNTRSSVLKRIVLDCDAEKRARRAKRTTNPAKPDEGVSPSVTPPSPDNGVVNPYIKRPPKALSLEAQVNVECDALATETSAAILAGGTSDGLPKVLQPPYPGSKAMLRIGDKWITSRFSSHIYKARRLPIMRQYCMEKYGMTDEVFDGVNWTSVGRVRRGYLKGRYSMFRQTSRYMHGWLPTMHMRQHITGIDQCPGCSRKDETIHHMLLCPHALMRKKREEILSELRKKGLKAKIPRVVVDALYAVLRNFFNPATTLQPSRHSSVQEAISQQQQLGIHMMVRGFVVKKWESAIDAMGVSKPDRAMDAMLRLLWEDVLTPLWHTRNDILHRNNNKFKEVEGTRLAERIQWYIEHKEEVLSVHDLHLARHDIATIHRMSCETRRQWVRHLDIARAAYENELTQREANQRVITRYLVPRQEE